MEMNYNPLICVTCFNQLDVTKRCIESIRGFDILVIDDCSTDGTMEYLTATTDGITLIPKPRRAGLTESWNIAYKYFKSTTFTHLIVTNNDVMFPDGAIEGMLSDHALTVPMTNHSGAGYVTRYQSIDFHIDAGSYDPGTVKHLQAVQNLTKRGFMPIRGWTGFCMCFSREIIKYEREDGNLVDPELINVGNDDYLIKTVPAMLALGSFVHHAKGSSFKGKIAGRDDLTKLY
jgi:glycosyltransferase involved in cell wall biosynthesis